MNPCYISVSFPRRYSFLILSFVVAHILLEHSQFKLSCQLEVDKGKLTATASFEKLTFRA